MLEFITTFEQRWIEWAMTSQVGLYVTVYVSIALAVLATLTIVQTMIATGKIKGVTYTKEVKEANKATTIE